MPPRGRFLPSVLLLALTVVLAPLPSSSHICLYQPAQRGAMVLDQPGDASCAHKGPEACGKVASAAPLVTLQAGAAYEVAFQQNLNHWFGAAPGFLQVQIALVADPVESDFTYTFGERIPDWNSMDEISYENFTIAGRVPQQTSEHAVLRLAYNSNNPLENDTSTWFYQCADIIIAAAPASDSGSSADSEEDTASLFSTSDPERSAASPPSAPDCCTAAQWEAKVEATSAFPAKNGNGALSYDAINHLLMYEPPSDPSGGGDILWQHFQNFSSGIEFRLNHQTGVCTVYGLDQWSDWCYGSTQNEEFVESVQFGSQTENVWVHPATGFHFGATADTCLPLARQRALTAETILYYDVTLGIADPAVFTPPSACQTHAAWSVCQHGTPQQIEALRLALPKAPQQSHKMHDADDAVTSTRATISEPAAAEAQQQHAHKRRSHRQ